MIRSLTSALALVAVLTASGAAFAAGAIAVDDEQGTKASEVGYGVGEGSTREEAAAMALKNCKESGNSSCQVVVRYDTCGAYAGSKKYAGKGWGKTDEIAKKKELDECGDSACRIIVADCSP